MANETKNVLSLESKDAMDFFLKSELYHGFELPEYFVFDELLQNVKKRLVIYHMKNVYRTRHHQRIFLM